jgi:hypothetical protein
MALGVQVHSALKRAGQQVFEAHARDVNFTGCGIGLRRRDGCVTDEPVVIAMVTKKLPAGALSRSRLLPGTVEADGRRWGVDVVEVGPLTLASRPDPAAGPDANGPISGTFRPLVQGCSISDLNGPQPGTGTLGCMVRDKSDNTICILGSNTVIAQDGLLDRLPPQDRTIVQPGLFDFGGVLDQVAILKRYVPFKKTGTNYVDAAIAKIHGVTYSQDVADNLMKPISATHPAVGMCLFSDPFGENCFLAPMKPTVSALGVELLPAKPGSSCIVAPQIGMNIEKVARTSAYTSSTVDALGVLLRVSDPATGRGYAFGGLIWTQGFHLPGDSGAVACQGGNGRTFVSPPSPSCPLLASAGHYLNLPLTKDNALTSQIKTQFLAQSLVGNLIIGLIYNNSHTAINRVKGKQAPGVEQAQARALYEKYLRLAKSALANPKSTKPVVTQDNLNDFQFALAGASGALGEPPLLTRAESAALRTIYNDVLVHTKGKDYQQLISYMNDVSVYEKTIKALAKVPTISLTGTPGEDELRKGH